ncbi:hypothetical protein [Hellea balneolensis]|uniref:hypothetical protein n=1 Tax=Hellea balneolensis TaxID=287478 RepID=UPI00040E0916|nr:hypothetical protein [Hellea balneolensis]
MTETPEDPQKPTLMDRGKKAMETADRAATVAESANNAFGAIKWAAIAIVTLTFVGGAYGIYKAVSAPAKAAADAAGAVTESVKSGAGKIKDSSAEVINRLDIPSSNQSVLNAAAEAAFDALTTMEASEPDGMKERLYRRTNFGGHENRICKFDADFGAGYIPIALAADNEAYATAKALGSKDDRLIRMIITAGEDDIALRTEWNSEAQIWVIRWKATTLKKEMSDALAEQRVIDVLGAARENCK